MTKEEQQSARRRMTSMKNNAAGHNFEQAIEEACKYYRNKRVADIQKTPEPFRVTRKGKSGTFTGRFGRKAQPDFQGTLRGGQSVIFEAKSTTADQIRRSALTEEQMDRLENHYRLGALAFVAVELGGRFYTVPWATWRDMKYQYNRKYMTTRDLMPFEVPYRCGVMFLQRLTLMD